LIVKTVKDISMMPSQGTERHNTKPKSNYYGYRVITHLNIVRAKEDTGTEYGDGIGVLQLLLGESVNRLSGGMDITFQAVLWIRIRSDPKLLAGSGA
jgi:hypothetical protein